MWWFFTAATTPCPSTNSDFPPLPPAVHSQNRPILVLARLLLPPPKMTRVSESWEKMPLLGQDQPAPPVSPGKEHRLVPLLIWIGVWITIFFIPLRIISYGYLPPDDGLRHPAKAVSGRAWSDIIVMQDQFRIDHNPGWHWVLGVVNRATQTSLENLAITGVALLALMVMAAPLGWLRRPEAWIASLLASVVFYPELLYRIFLGRPLAASMAATIAILLLWRKPDAAKPKWTVVLGTVVLFGLAAWIHGSWYLLALIPASFALAGQWRNALWLAGSWLGGSFLGGLLTGQPFAFLWNAINIALSCFGNNQVQRVLVGEFGPSDGAYPAILLAAVLLAARAATGTWTWKRVNNPVFMLFLLGWALGLGVVRFWVDWGIPALALWTALEIHEHSTRLLNENSLRRVGVAAGLCAAFFLGATSDVKGRWTDNLVTEHLTASNPEMAPWLPEDGGTIYSSYMGVFYHTFFRNPHANWKYILGFESTFMPPEDLRILRNIQWNYHAPKAHEPWVAKMRPEDRMVVLGRSSVPPTIEGLEWKNIARETWVGRLPRQPTK